MRYLKDWRKEFLSVDEWMKLHCYNPVAPHRHWVSPGGAHPITKYPVRPRIPGREHLLMTLYHHHRIGEIVDILGTQYALLQYANDVDISIFVKERNLCMLEILKRCPTLTEIWTVPIGYEGNMVVHERSFLDAIRESQVVGIGFPGTESDIDDGAPRPNPEDGINPYALIPRPEDREWGRRFFEEREWNPKRDFIVVIHCKHGGSGGNGWFGNHRSHPYNFYDTWKQIDKGRLLLTELPKRYANIKWCILGTMKYEGVFANLVGNNIINTIPLNLDFPQQVGLMANADMWFGYYLAGMTRVALVMQMKYHVTINDGFLMPEAFEYWTFARPRYYHRIDYLKPEYSLGSIFAELDYIFKNDKKLGGTV